MKSEGAPSGSRSPERSREQFLARAIEAGRERRKRNRELLIQREHAKAPPPSAPREVVKLLICAILFLPLIGIGIALAASVEANYGSTAAWIVALAGSALLAAVIYNGPRLVRAMASDIIGLVKYRQRNPGAFWGAIALILGMILLLYGGLQRNPAIKHPARAISPR